MNKAEERAFAYQRELGMHDSVSDEHIVARRMGFYDGYRQAEKDLALTWEDILIIHEKIRAVYDIAIMAEMDSKQIYEEVLRRFKKVKEEKK